MKNTDITVLLMSAVAFVICTLGIIISPTILSQIFFTIIDLFIVTLIVFLLNEFKDHN